MLRIFETPFRVSTYPHVITYFFSIQAYFSIGHIMFTFMAAVVVTLLFESPFMAIEKLFLPRKPMRKEMP